MSFDFFHTSANSPFKSSNWNIILHIPSISSPTAPKNLQPSSGLSSQSPFSTFHRQPSSTIPATMVTPFIAPSSSQSINRLSASSQSGRKRKRSTIPDLDEEGYLKRRGSCPNIQPGDTAMLQGIQALMNQFSDIVRSNNETTQHSILKDATSNLTKGEKIKVLELFGEQQSLALIYSSTKDSDLHCRYILHMLSPFHQQIDELDKTLAG